MKRVCQALVSLMFVLLCTATVSAQEQEGAIILDNPSFEDMPRHSRAPRFWTNCGFVNESPPDIQPDYTFQVNKAAFEGNTYLGMVTRDNDTWEAVGQLLSQPLRDGSCYEFSIKLARSLSYYSVSRETQLAANYVQPVKLRIWAGFGMCDKREMLGESTLVENTDWQEFHFNLAPSGNYTHLVMEVFYKTPSLFPYNGNLLLDDASPLRPIPCDTNIEEGPTDPTVQDLIVDTREPDPDPKPVLKPKGRDNPEPTDRDLTSRSNNGPKNTFDDENLDVGTTFPLEEVNFEANSTDLPVASRQYLNELEAFLRNRTDVIVEIGGHTNSLPDKVYADELSTLRAKAVVDYLKEQGIPAVQLRFRGYGKRFPIATNDTEEGRRENQRVEVKIIAIIKQ
ncbi:MAG: OmpA family protein [Bacteroidota bacterium]